MTSIEAKFAPNAAKEACSACSKTVYANERLAVDDRVYHKNCLRCAHCDKIITLGNYAALNGVMYCKPHFKQLFAVKGNYTDGFQNAEAKSNMVTSPRTVSEAVHKGVEASSPLSKAKSSSLELLSKEEADLRAKQAVLIAEQLAKEQEEKIANEKAAKIAKEQLESLAREQALLAQQNQERAKEAELSAKESHEHLSKGRDVGSKIGDTAEPKFAPNAAKEACSACSKTVYANERLAVDDRVYHKNCLRCAHCDKIITLGNYAALNGVMYCKPHFKQLFAVKGNYTDGFQNAEAKSNTVTSPRSVSDAEGVTSPVYQAKSDLIAKEQAERAAKDHAEMLNKKEAEERVAAQKREEQRLDAEREQQALQIKKEAEQRLALQIREEKRLEAERQQEALKIQKEAEERLAMERREAEERAKVEAEKEKQKEVLKLKEELHALESDLKERQMQVDQLVKHIDQKKNELILVSSK